MHIDEVRIASTNAAVPYGNESGRSHRYSRIAFSLLILNVGFTEYLDVCANT
jgi:hypothetical protein